MATGFAAATNNFLGGIANVSTAVYVTPAHSGTQFGELNIYYQLSHDDVADSDLPEQGDHIGGDSDSGIAESRYCVDWCGNKSN